ncbi:hypothetical protein AArcSt11_08555 [Natranaeroarchaeum aerophilus]|uniref:Uncharacterized protein n=1 Tax=Natranaeroarchaeum aerophilus TaxID=2917711 RepID=A0AAE3K553_9EURY|nr:hypothetical protein [Natranaeroarchaeum aerophilus]
MYRYDWILVAIPVALLSGWIIGVLTVVPIEYGMVAGVVLATPFVYDAIFRNPPLPESDVQRAFAAILWHVLVVWTIIVAVW